METKKYRKKPVEVEAVQFTKENKDQVYSWATSIQMNVWAHGTLEEPKLAIPTNEGTMFCEVGDFLIKEPFPINDRKLYPCKPDIFEATYEEVTNIKNT